MTPAQYVASGDVSLAVYTWGQRSTKQSPRPTLLLIHGYPDRAAVWAPVAEQLAARFHVVAYDVRGAGQSTAPAGSAAYAFAHLNADLRAVIDAVSPDQPVHLIAYDWGALQAWDALLSGALEGRVASYSTAAPHMDLVGHWFHEKFSNPTPGNLVQGVRRALGSFYMLMIQSPVLPELTWKLGLAKIWPHLVSKLEGIAIPESESQLADAIGGLGIYRANVLPPLLRPQTRSTDVPVQALIMTRDPFVPMAMFEGLETSAPHLRRTEFDAGHWWPLSQSQAVAECIADFVVSIEGA